MTIEVLTPISYGKDRMVYDLKPGPKGFVEDDFFDKDTLDKFLGLKYLRYSKEDANSKLKGEDLGAPLVDITSFTVAEGKEFIDKEVDLVRLEKFLDMENADDTPRSTLVKFIEGRIKELTGYDTEPK